MTYKVSRLLADRTMGGFPISIGTSFALQSIFGYPIEISEDNKPLIRSNVQPYLGYSDILINTRTIVRNFVNAIDAKAVDTIRSSDIVHGIMGEIELCNELIKGQSNGRLNCSFYDIDYLGIEKKFPYAIFKEAKTEKQLHYKKIENECVVDLRQHLNYVPYRQYRREITDSFGKTLLLTHIAPDLLSRYSFSEVVLLESHTGRIKDRDLWYSKLSSTNKDDLINIPFGSFSIQVFGDGIIFAPNSLAMRKQVLSIASQGRWLYSTTVDKIRNDINKYTSDPTLKGDLLKLL